MASENSCIPISELWAKWILFLLLSCILDVTSVGAEGHATDSADLLLVRKANRTLELFSRGRLLRSYRVALGGAPLGPKRCQGDRKTPEGIYVIAGRNINSQFHRSLRVSYPNAEDRLHSKKQRCDPGGDIMIHGLPNGRGWLGAAHRQVDWTNGCIAVTDAEIEEVWALVRDGTKVQIQP